MVRPSRELARDTRREILDASLELFAQGGFHGTSMRKIARAVGVRESALYHHFPAKEAILEQLMRELGPGKAERLANLDLDALFGSGGTREVLRGLAQGLIDEWATPAEQKFIRLMMAEGPRLGVSGHIHPQVFLGRARSLMAAFFAEMIKRGLIRKADPEAVALAFMGPMIALRMMYLVLSGAPDLRKLRAQVDSHLNFFWESVRP